MSTLAALGLEQVSCEAASTRSLLVVVEDVTARHNDIMELHTFVQSCTPVLLVSVSSVFNSLGRENNHNKTLTPNHESPSLGLSGAHTLRCGGASSPEGLL